MISSSASIVWFHSDLRLEDNPALNSAILSGNSVIPLYIWDESRHYFAKMGSASKWWLHHSLKSLANDLKKRGLNLQIFKGDTLEILSSLQDQFESIDVFWNRRYEPDSYNSDARIIRELKANGVGVEVFSSYSLFEPDQIRIRPVGFIRYLPPFGKDASKI